MVVKSDWFAELLKLYVQRTGFTLSQLSQLSGIPKPTLANWLSGRVKKPRHRSDVIQLVQSLHLEEFETQELLKAAGYSSTDGEATAENQFTHSPEHTPSEAKKGRIPFQAIPDLPYFVGRETELANIKKALLNDQEDHILTLEGMPGVGKTALAGHLAYQMRHFFPDGVLWARLNRSSPEAILSTFANAYSVEVEEHAPVASHSRILREILADKRTLILLDDAWEIDQILPFLPPTGDSRLIVTTPRRALLGAIGARPFHLGPFPASGGDSLKLFSQLVGQQVVEKNRQAFLELACMLGHLPLALAIAANRLAFEPDWGILQYLIHMQRPKQRLDLLVYEEKSLRSAFSRSVQMLDWHEKSFFYSLAELNPVGFSAQTAAAHNQLPAGQTQAYLRKLYHLFLVEMQAPDRFYLHTLVLDYARQALDLSNEDSPQS
jgi:transcriptional regulator with XRE-family HTH domain